MLQGGRFLADDAFVASMPAARMHNEILISPTGTEVLCGDTLKSDPRRSVAARLFVSPWNRKVVSANHKEF